MFRKSLNKIGWILVYDANSLYVVPLCVPISMFSFVFTRSVIMLYVGSSERMESYESLGPVCWVFGELFPRNNRAWNDIFVNTDFENRDKWPFFVVVVAVARIVCNPVSCLDGLLAVWFTFLCWQFPHENNDIDGFLLHFIDLPVTIFLGRKDFVQCWWLAQFQGVLLLSR